MLTACQKYRAEELLHRGHRADDTPDGSDRGDDRRDDQTPLDGEEDHCCWCDDRG